MYGLIRRAHAYTGLLLVLFVLMYFMTGILLTEGARFGSGGSDVTEMRVPFRYTGPDDPPAMVRYLEDEFAVSGKRLPADYDGSGMRRFRWSRPGTMVQIVAPVGADSITIVTEDRGPLRTAALLHRLHGYGGGFAFDIWAVLYDLVSLAMIVFSVTGVFLWYRRTRDRRLGWALMTLSWGFTAVVYAVLWFAP